MQNKITPPQMATLYWNRLHRAAFAEVALLLEGFKESENTTRYWLEVQSCLQAKLPR